MLLTPGNRKLGGQLIWGFGLPSGATACPGSTELCRRYCYAKRLETLRPSVARRYAHNLALSRRPDFSRRVRWFILAHEIRVVRVHIGGDFYSDEYARKWLRVMQRLRAVRFYFYTRSWRDSVINPAIEAMSALPNVRAWYSVDRETGPPVVLPKQVRVAWLMTSSDDAPPSSADLTFRTVPLRRRVTLSVNTVSVCAAESGLHPATSCDRCGVCWR